MTACISSRAATASRESVAASHDGGGGSGRGGSSWSDAMSSYISARHPALAAPPGPARIAAKAAELPRAESVCPIPSLNWKDAAAGRPATSTAAPAPECASAVGGIGGGLTMPEVCPIPAVHWRAARAHDPLGGPLIPKALSLPASPPTGSPTLASHVAVSRGGVAGRRIVPRTCSLNDDAGDGGAAGVKPLTASRPLGRSSSVEQFTDSSAAHASNPIRPASSGGHGSSSGAFASSGSRGHRRRHSALPDLGGGSFTSPGGHSALAGGSTPGDASLVAAAAALASGEAGVVAAGPAGHVRWNPLQRGGSTGGGGHKARDHSPARRSRLICMRRAGGHSRHASWDGSHTPDLSALAVSTDGQQREGAAGGVWEAAGFAASAVAEGRPGSGSRASSMAPRSSHMQPSMARSAGTHGHAGTHGGAVVHVPGEGEEAEAEEEEEAEECPSVCLNWEGVQQLCAGMQLAGIAIDSIDILALPLAPSTHSTARTAASPPPPPPAPLAKDPLHAAAAGQPTMEAAERAAVGECAAAALEPCSLHQPSTAPCTSFACHSPAAATAAAAGGAAEFEVLLAVRFCGMSGWYHPGDDATRHRFQI
ncbi:hypothetical protein CLOP_g8525 [Closterium sp. NIES-67]|nr:hypothetical protein CLOP_g8525 [Closterium sp. NIES-67]